jgi:hypothetical protein
MTSGVADAGQAGARPCLPFLERFLDRSAARREMVHSALFSIRKTKQRLAAGSDVLATDQNRAGGIRTHGLHVPNVAL